MERFKGKYRTKSLRLQNYDYSSNGLYFITICIRNWKEHLLGEIVNDVMSDTEEKKICEEYWDDLPNHYDQCEIDVFGVMPNHVHGIIRIDNGPDNDSVEKIHEFFLRNRGKMSMQDYRKYRRQMLLFKIIGRFKMQTAKEINLLQKTSGLPFWQHDYYEHIVRDEKELEAIREYIINNPKNWEKDRFYN